MSTKPDKGRTASINDAMDVDIAKAEAQHPEGSVPKPESIQDMTDGELDAVRKKMVRKMDMVIMPIMGILYLLNCLFRVITIFFGRPLTCDRR